LLTFIRPGDQHLGAWLFAAGSFRWAGVVVIGAGLFDIWWTAAWPAHPQVTRFAASSIRWWTAFDLALLRGLLVYYASIKPFFYIVLTAVVMTGSVMVS